MTRSVRLLLPAGFVLALCLTGCGGGSSATTDAGGATGASTGPSTATSASSSPTTEPVPADDGNPVVAADFCALLDKLAPQLASDGSPAGALADLTIGLSGWIEDHPEQQPRTADDLDEASIAGCAATREKVLASLGTSSFAQAF